MKHHPVVFFGAGGHQNIHVPVNYHYCLRCRSISAHLGRRLVLVRIVLNRWRNRRYTKACGKSEGTQVVSLLEP